MLGKHDIKNNDINYLVRFTWIANVKSEFKILNPTFVSDLTLQI